MLPALISAPSVGCWERAHGIPTVLGQDAWEEDSTLGGKGLAPGVRKIWVQMRALLFGCGAMGLTGPL